jgi:phosphoglycerate dehydrogenase-like enzyme
MTVAHPRVLSHLGALPGVAAALPGVEVIALPSEGPLAPDVEGEVLFTVMRGAPNLAEVLRRGVKWVHTLGTGIEEFPLDLLDGQVLTCSRGATAVPIAEWVMAQILAVEKQLPGAWVRDPPERWGTPVLGTLEGRTIAVLGMGTIGVALARRALAFDTHVRALRRSDRPSPVDGVEMVHDVEQLVAGAHHVVLAAPATAQTRGIVAAEFLAAMPPGAHLVNVARSELVDEGALRDALDCEHLGWASLDVAPVEPLPAGHWLYRHPRVRLSAHVSWSGPQVWQSIERSFIDNYRRYRAGEPLANIVDTELGY